MQGGYRKKKETKEYYGCKTLKIQKNLLDTRPSKETSNI